MTERGWRMMSGVWTIRLIVFFYKLFSSLCLVSCMRTVLSDYLILSSCHTVTVNPESFFKIPSSYPRLRKRNKRSGREGHLSRLWLFPLSPTKITFIRSEVFPWTTIVMIAVTSAHNFCSAAGKNRSEVGKATKDGPKAGDKKRRAHKTGGKWQTEHTGTDAKDRSVNGERCGISDTPVTPLLQQPPEESFHHNDDDCYRRVHVTSDIFLSKLKKSKIQLPHPPSGVGR